MYSTSYYATYGFVYYVGIEVPDPSTVTPVLGFVTTIQTRPMETSLTIGINS